MNLQATPYMLIPLLLTFMAWGLLLHAWKYREIPGIRSFIITLLVVSGWALSYVLELVSTMPTAILFWKSLEYTGKAFTPVFWCCFALAYTGQMKPGLRPFRYALFIIPTLSMFLALTNPMHDLVWHQMTELESTALVLFRVTAYGPWHWLQVAYACMVTALSIWALIVFSRSTSSTHKYEAVIMISSIILPWGGALLSYFDIPGEFHFDLTHTGLLLGTSLLVHSTLQYKFLNLTPLPLRTVVSNIQDAILTVNSQNYVIDVNPAAQRLLIKPGAFGPGEKLHKVISAKFLKYLNGEATEEIIEEVQVKEAEKGTCYELWARPIHDDQQQFCGRLILLRDITKRKNLEATLASQRGQFEELLTVARATAENPSLKATLQNSLDIAITLTRAEKGSICLMNSKGKVTHSILIRGSIPAIEAQNLINRVLDCGLAGWLQKHQQVALIEDTQADERWLTLPDQPYTAGSALGIPIIQGTTLLGQLILIHAQPHHFTPHDAGIMQTAVQQMALAIRNAQIYEEQRRTASQQVTLYEVLRTLQRPKAPNSVIEQAVQAIHDLTDWPLVAFLTPTDDDAYLRIEKASGELAPPADWRIDSNCSVFGKAIKTTISQYTSNIENNTEVIPGLETVASLMLVPMLQGKRVKRLLLVASDKALAFDADARLLSESLAEAVNLALVNANLYQALQKELLERDRMEERLWMTLNKTDSLYRISRSVIGTYNLSEVLRTLVNGVVTALRANRAIIILLDTEDRRIVNFVTGGPGADQIGVSSFDQLMKGKSGEALQNNRPIITTLNNDGSRIIVPLQSYQKTSYQEPVSGLIIAENRPDQRAFTQQDTELMQAIAAQAAAAIQNTQLFQAVVEERGRLQAVVQSSRDGIILIGMDLRVLVINHMALDYLGLQDIPENWVGLTIWEILRPLRKTKPKVVKVVLEEMRRIRNGDTIATEDELQVNSHFYHWMSLPVVAEGHPLGRLIAMQDVTEVRLLEKLREDLTYTMVHDLRSPITGIYGALQLFTKSISPQLNAGQIQMLQIAQSSTERMLKLVNAILDISRLESGRMPLNRSESVMRKLVNDVLSVEKLNAEQRHITIENTVLPNLPHVDIDEELISRVIQNLIDNALKFTPSKGTVRLSAQLDPEDKDKLLVSVRDTGPGIPKGLKNRLFQKFVTGDQDGRGTGLGLAFCRMVLEAHGERIWVESQLGHGAVFKFTLPIAKSS